MNKIKSNVIEYGALIIIVVVLSIQNAKAQTILTGKILDAQTTESLVGATVIIKGTTQGTTTNMNGEFSFEYDNGFPLTLVFSYIGYETKELELIENHKIEIYLV